jgi:hypothetical protein
VRELRDWVKVGAGIDPLRDFSEVAREELRLLKGRWTTHCATFKEIGNRRSFLTR